MKKLLALLLSLSMVFFCACGDSTESETSSDSVEKVSEEIVETEEPTEEPLDSEEGYDEDHEYGDTLEELPSTTQQFVELLINEEYGEICDIYGINREDFPEEYADEMISMAFDGESPEDVLYEYVDSYEMSTETTTEETSQIVYVTRTGSKYHSYGCRYLSKSCIEKDLSVAQSQGYTPCSKCW